jgi:uncharacterized protein (DUF2062 family)
MFRRRRPPPLPSRLRSWFWPRSGWRRAFSFHWLRLQRLSGSPERIAAGFACGVAWAWTPLFGVHTFAALATAWLFRASLPAAFIGTFMLNPWTAVPIWFATYYLGRMLMFHTASTAVSAGDFVTMFASLTRAALQLDLALLASDVLPLLLPMLIGCVPLGAGAGAMAFIALRFAIRKVHARRTGARGERR